MLKGHAKAGLKAVKAEHNCYLTNGTIYFIISKNQYLDALTGKSSNFDGYTGKMGQRLKAYL
jgi:hypothetical protein